LVTTEAMVAELPKEKPAMPAMPGGMAEWAAWITEASGAAPCAAPHHFTDVQYRLLSGAAFDQMRIRRLAATSSDDFCSIDGAIFWHHMGISGQNPPWRASASKAAKLRPAIV